MTKPASEMSTLEIAAALPGAALRSFFARRRSTPLDGSGHHRLRRHNPLKSLAKSDVWVDELRACAVDTVWACVRAKTDPPAASDWDLFYRDPKTGDREPADYALWYLLNKRPNPEMTGVQFKRYWLRGACLSHGGLAEIETNRLGRPVNLWHIENRRWYRERQAGQVQFRVTGNEGGDQIFYPGEVLYLPPDSLDGENPVPIVEWARGAIANAISAHDYGEKFFANAGVLSLVLETDEEMDPEQMREATEAFIETYTGSGKWHGVAGLHSGLKAKNLTPPVEAAQLVEAKEYLVEVICRFFGVPPHLVGHLKRATYSNIEHQGLDFIRYGLAGLCESVGQEVSTKLFPNDPLAECRVQIEWLAEGDAKTKAELERIRRSNGVITVNEARRKAGENGIGPEGDTRHMQQGFTTLDRVNRGETLKGGRQVEIPGPDEDNGEGDLDRAP